MLWLVPLGLWFALRWYYTLYFKRLSCVLTDRKLKVGKGLLFRTEKAIPLDKITDMAMNQGPLMRYLDLESISVETASGGGGAHGSGAIVTLVGIEGSRDFREAVLEQRDRVVGSAEVLGDEAPSAAAAAPAAHDAAVLAEIRDILRRIDARLEQDRSTPA